MINSVSSVPKMISDLLLSEKHKYRSFPLYHSEVGLEFFNLPSPEFFFTIQTLKLYLCRVGR